MRRLVALLALSASALVAAGCDQLDGRNKTRHGNRLFKASKFVEAAVEYELALKKVDDPTIHYNLGLTYMKIARPGSDQPVRIGVAGTTECSLLKGTQPEDARVCVKNNPAEEDRRFEDCDEKDAKTVCASSYTCKQVTLCTMTPAAIAEQSTNHFQIWIKAQQPDAVIEPKLKAAEEALAKAREKADVKELDEAEKRVNELRAKDDTRTLMTQQWWDSQQYQRATDYWKGLLAERPNDFGILGTLAGTANKAGDWRSSIEWYLKAADAAPDMDNQVASYQAVGYIAFAYLKKGTLTAPEVMEASDRGIAALQKAAALSPKTPRLVGLQGSLFRYRSLAQGSSWAWLADRASAQDLQSFANVLTKEAKKAQEQGTATPSTQPPASPTATAPKAGAGG